MSHYRALGLRGDLTDHVAHGKRHHLEDDRVTDRQKGTDRIPRAISAHVGDDALSRGQTDSLGARKITTLPRPAAKREAALAPFTATSILPDEPTTATSAPGATSPYVRDSGSRSPATSTDAAVTPSGARRLVTRFPKRSTCTTSPCMTSAPMTGAGLASLIRPLGSISGPTSRKSPPRARYAATGANTSRP